MKVKKFDGICGNCIHCGARDCFADEERNIIRDEVTNAVCDCDCYEEDDNYFIK